MIFPKESCILVRATPFSILIKLEIQTRAHVYLHLNIQKKNTWLNGRGWNVLDPSYLFDVISFPYSRSQIWSSGQITKKCKMSNKYDLLLTFSFVIQMMEIYVHDAIYTQKYVAFICSSQQFLINPLLHTTGYIRPT